MLLTGFARRMSLRAAISQAQYRLITLSRRIQELQQYSANIGDGIITPDEMATTPASMVGRQMMFSRQTMMYGMNMGNQAFMRYLPQYRAQMNMIAQGGDRMMYEMMRQQEPMLRWNFVKQAMEKISKQEEKKLHVEEKRLTQEKDKLEMQIKMMQAEFDSLTSFEDKEIQRSAPKFA